jgi:steroid delta-isomerase-like uncharacterized protein
MRIVGMLTLGIVAAACSETPAPKIPPAPPMPPAPPSAEAVAAPAPAPAPARPSMADMQKKSIAASAAAWAAHDADKIVALYAADGVFASPGPAGWEEKKGREQMKKEMTELFAGFPDSRIGYVRVLHKGDVAVAEWVVTGTNSGPFAGEKATGKPVGIRGASVMWFDADGLVKRENMYMDHATMMGQMGRGPKGMPVRPPAALPAGEPEWVAAEAPEDAANAEAVKAMYATFEKKDSAGFLGALADDVEYVDATAPADMKGKDTAKKFFETITKAMPDLKVSATSLWSVGGYTMAEVAHTGTLKGALGPVKPTNKSGTTHALEIIQFKGGKMARGWGYASMAELATVYGLGPKPGAPAAGKAPAPAAKAPAAAPKAPAGPAPKPAPAPAKPPAKK